MRKGKSTSVDTGEGAKEEEAAEGGEVAAATEEGGADGEAAAATAEVNDKDAAIAAEKTPAEESGAEVAKEPEKEVEKTTAEAPVTNGENGCSNGTEEETTTHNHQEEEEEEKTTGSSPMKKSKEAGGVQDEANAKIINATAAVNSGELEHADRDSDEPQNSSSSKDGEANGKRQEVLTNDSNKHAARRDRQTQIALAVSGEKGEGQGEAESPQNGGCHDAEDTYDQGEEGEEEEMRKRDLREAAVVIVQNVMSAATDQLEKELCVDNGLNGCYDADARY